MLKQDKYTDTNSTPLFFLQFTSVFWLVLNKINRFLEAIFVLNALENRHSRLLTPLTNFLKGAKSILLTAAIRYRLYRGISMITMYQYHC